MDFYFLIGYRQCGLNEILIMIKYILKRRPINLATDIVALAIDLLVGKLIKNHWSVRRLVPNKHSSTQSFILLLDSFIRNVFITDSVLHSICALPQIQSAHTGSMRALTAASTFAHSASRRSALLARMRSSSLMRLSRSAATRAAGPRSARAYSDDWAPRYRRATQGGSSKLTQAPPGAARAHCLAVPADMRPKAACCQECFNFGCWLELAVVLLSIE